jgi:hypothetical protein
MEQLTYLWCSQCHFPPGCYDQACALRQDATLFAPCVQAKVAAMSCHFAAISTKMLAPDLSDARGSRKASLIQ